MEENNKDKTRDIIEQANKRISQDIPDYIKQGLLKTRKQTLKLLFILFSIEFIIILGNVFGFIFLPNQPIYILVKVIMVILSIIIFISVGFIILFRFIIFNDWERIQQKIILFRGNYVKAVFFSNQKRIKYRAVVPDINAREFYLNGLLYLIDMSCVYTDEDGIPTLFYLIGMPNPLKFDFLKYLELYFTRLQNGEHEENIKENLDVRYSSETLKLLKNDSLMSNMHKDRTAEQYKIFIYFFIIIGLLIIVIIIMAILGNKTPVVNVMQNTTGNIPIPR